MVEDQIQGSSGTASASATIGASDIWAAGLAAFKAAAGTGGSSPSITSLNPASGAVGTSVTITGANFGATQGSSTVKFNGTAGTPSSWSATSIVVPVPAGASTGNVVVTVGGVASNGVNFTVTTSGSITIAISPKRAGLAITQTLNVAATTNDTAGVKWSASGASCSGTACGSFSAGSSLSGVSVTFTAPGAAGIYEITATSVSNITTSASITVGVTDLSGVYTWHDNLNRDGSNTQEYALTPSLVTTSTFGRLFTCSIDSAAYAQPLWVANVSIAGGKHNVLYVATQQDTIYAFDADASPCVTLGSRKLARNQRDLAVHNRRQFDRHFAVDRNHWNSGH